MRGRDVFSGLMQRCHTRAAAAGDDAAGRRKPDFGAGSDWRAMLSSIGNIIYEKKRLRQGEPAWANLLGRAPPQSWRIAIFFRI